MMHAFLVDRPASRRLAAALLLIATALPLGAQRGAPVTTPPQWLNADTAKKTNQSNFRGIEQWPTPNEYRTGSGSPGPKYWQQKVDYAIKVALDTTHHEISGTERVTYHNNSPGPLPYLWFQLDQNVERPDSRAAVSTRAIPKGMATLSPQALRMLGLAGDDAQPLGMRIAKVRTIGANGARADAPFFTNGTSMRVELPAPVA